MNKFPQACFPVSCTGASKIRCSLTLTPGRTIRQIWGKVSNIYIIEDGHAIYLVDCGMLSDTKAIIAALPTDKRLERIVCTHFHIDHIRSWARIKKKFPKTEIWFYYKAKPFVYGCVRVPFPSCKGITKAMIPVMKEYRYCLTPYELLRSELYGTPFKKKCFPLDRVALFTDHQAPLPGFCVVPTPGHTPDSVSFLDPTCGVFLTGDFLIVIKGKLVVNPFVVDPCVQRSSWLKIQKMHGIRFICPGHGICLPYPRPCPEPREQVQLS